VKRLAIATFAAVFALSAWLSVDEAMHRQHSIREFDSHAVGRIERDMWRAYYEHRSLSLFFELTALLRTQYHLSVSDSYRGAFYAARAAETFQAGRTRSDYRRALPDIERFYGVIRDGSDIAFDADRAARLELEWWIVHREYSRPPDGDLERALAGLQAEVYQLPRQRFEGHARARAAAMLIRDEKEAAGGLTESDWGRIGSLLEDSWTSLADALNAPGSEECKHANGNVQRNHRMCESSSGTARPLRDGTIRGV
jgi:hypothetical protein